MARNSVLGTRYSCPTSNFSARRERGVEELIGRPYDLQELQINLVTLSGNLDEDDDEIEDYVREQMDAFPPDMLHAEIERDRYAFLG